jgi:hypothetical protein
MRQQAASAFASALCEFEINGVFALNKRRVCHLKGTEPIVFILADFEWFILQQSFRDGTAAIVISKNERGGEFVSWEGWRAPSSRVLSI